MTQVTRRAWLDGNAAVAGRAMTAVLATGRLHVAAMDRAREGEGG